MSAEAARKDRLWICLLCALATLRVLVYSTAFPLFNNVDEQKHFDLVVKYAQGRLLRQTDLPISPESARYFAVYNSPEYISRPTDFSGRAYPPPLWRQPPEQGGPMFAAGLADWKAQLNPELTSPPLYHAAAAVWLKLGQRCGMVGGNLAHWVRGSNVLIVLGLVWLGYLTARLIFPDRPFLRLGVPALLALHPQDIFYSVQNDTLMALAFGASFYGLLRLWRSEPPGLLTAALTGLALAATGLAKTTSLPLLAVAALGIAVMIARWAAAKKLPAALPSLALLGLCTALPLILWFAWSRREFGDFTGSGIKTQLLGWTPKPLGDWWSHPILRPGGWWVFGTELFASFWRGEFHWQGRPMALAGMDVLYWLTTLGLTGFAIFTLAAKRREPMTPERPALWFCLATFVAAVAFLGVASMAYDFGQCVYPSRAFPYFVSGRLLSGALIPFCVIYLYGWDQAMGRLGCSDRARVISLGVWLGLITLSEAWINLPAFSSPYNLFHFWG
jgi:hypothetical protein